MGKLIRYEFRKTILGKNIILAILGTLELIFLVSLLTDSDDLIVLSIFLLVTAASNSINFIGLWSLICLHRDMNTKQSYMLFMTPNSSYKILGAKVVETSVSVLATGAFVGALGFLDVALLLRHFSAVDDFLRLMRSLGGEVAAILSMNTGTVILFLLAVLSMWLMMVNIAFLADALSTTLLRGKKAGFLVTLAFFLVMFIGMIALMNVIPNTFDAKQFLIYIGIAVTVSAGAYLGAAKLMDAKLSV